MQPHVKHDDRIVKLLTFKAAAAGADCNDGNSHAMALKGERCVGQTSG
jgi:hypothetical protein